MKESKMTEKLAMHWVPVVDARGRTHMEAVWYTPRAGVHHTTHAA